MAYARENSLRLKHLMLVDMGPQMARAGARGLKANMAAKADRPPSVFTIDKAREFYREQWPTLDEPSIERLIENSLVRNEDSDGDKEVYSNRYDRALRDVTTKSAIPEIPFLWEALTHVKCPAMVLRGENSHILDDEIASRMVSALPNGQLYVFEDTGHSSPRLEPEQFAGVVRRILLNQPVDA